MPARTNSAANEELVFTVESVRYLDAVADHVWEGLYAAALEKVEREGHSFVTTEDVRSCVHAALGKVIEMEEAPSSVRG